MSITLLPGPRRGTVRVPSSKSHIQRLLLAAALGNKAVTIHCRGVSRDVSSMMSCLSALGAEITSQKDLIRIVPIPNTPCDPITLSCGESGAVLRFLLPITGALGTETFLERDGRLSKRPIAPLDAVLRKHGMEIWAEEKRLHCKGKLLAGKYEIRGNISSQYISGLLFTLPLLNGNSSLTIMGESVSRPYIAMTEDVLRMAKIHFQKASQRYTIWGGQQFSLPEQMDTEGDWSGAAAFLCMGALSPEGIRVEGLSAGSCQADRALTDILRRFGAEVLETDTAVVVRRKTLRGCSFDASQTPDLVPVLTSLAAVSEGKSYIYHAARLRDKESNRLESMVSMLRTLGADISETSDGLAISGVEHLTGGEVDSSGDHRIAMAAAVAACACKQPVTVRSESCVDKSYPAFWEDFTWLSM